MARPRHAKAEYSTTEKEMTPDAVIVWDWSVALERGLLLEAQGYDDACTLAWDRAPERRQMARGSFSMALEAQIGDVRVYESYSKT